MTYGPGYDRCLRFVVINRHMMDGLSVAASIIAVVQLSAQVFSLCQEYYIGVKQSRDEIERLSNEVLAIHEILEKISELLDGPDATNFATLALLDREDGPTQQCAAQLQEIQAQLDPHEGMRKMGWRALKWPLKSDKVNKIVLTLERYKAAFTLALATDQANLSVKIDTGIEELKENFARARIDDDMSRHEQSEERLRKEVIVWLSTTDPSTNHAEQRRRHQPTTGRWLVNSKAMADWRSNPNSFIWLHGTAGCGKTVLSSTIIDHIQANLLHSSKCALAYYYFDFNEPAKQKAANFLSSIVAQLCSRCSVLPDGARELHQRCSDGHLRPTTKDLLAALKGALSGFEDIFLVADALDECPKDNDERQDLWKIFKSIHNWSNPRLHLLTTSRREPDIESMLSSMLTTPAISIDTAQVDADIKIHVQCELEALSQDKKWPQDLMNEVEETLVRGAHGMFRWVFCQLQALKSCLKPSLVRKKLKSLPKDLEETYARILNEIHEDYREDALIALKWLTFSGRPLMLDELIESLLVSPSREPAFDPEYRLSDPYDIMQILPGLVSISINSKYNREEIRLAHFSVKEYLMSDKIGFGPTAYFGTTVVAANQFITEACLAYILHYSAAKERTFSVEDLRLFPLLRYACRYWYIHMRAIMNNRHLVSDPRSSTNVLFVQLLHSEAAIRGWLLVHRPDVMGKKPFPKFVGPDELGSAIYYTAYLDLQDAVRMLLDGKNIDYRAEAVNAKGGYYGRPLCAAAANGHTQMCQILLDHGANLEYEGSDFKHWGTGTALGLAARFGHEATVRLLLEKGANVEGRSGVYYGPGICAAASNGHERVVRLLLDHGASINAQAPDGRTSFHGAALGGHLGVVKILLEYKADTEAPNKYEETPLIRAAIKDEAELVAFLVERGANIEAKDHEGYTALHRTVRHSRRAAFAVLFDKGANLATRGEDGKTLLHSAAARDDMYMLRRILDAGADVESQDREGLTPLHEAASSGEAGAILILLGEGANLHAIDKDGQTPLHKAASKGEDHAMHWLIIKGADREAKDNYNDTPLHLAAIGGRENAVQLLLDQGVNIEARNSAGETPLFKAVYGETSAENIVRSLLDQGASVEVRATGPPDFVKGWTVLHGAAFAGNGNVVRMLLAKGGEVNATDAMGMTPMVLATVRDFTGTDALRVLRENGGIVGRGRSSTDYSKIFIDGLTLRMAEE